MFVNKGKELGKSSSIFDSSVLVDSNNDSTETLLKVALKEMCRFVQDVGKLRFSFWLTEIFTNLTWGYFLFLVF
jgi:hypothetical protein